MSMQVSFIPKSSDFKIEDLEKEIQYPYNDLFGFEVWRKELWGHDIIKAIGCRLLFSLKETDIYVFDEDIQNLKNELNLVIENIDKIVH
jgi:hypothetical protein